MHEAAHIAERLGRLRTKWAATGAAVAVTLGAGGIGIARAAVDSGPMPIYQAIEPCRLADTRADSTVGQRNTPLGAAETHTFAGWGVTGGCELPDATSALQLNVTAIGATLPTFIAVFPAGSEVPTASNLNPTPGAPPTPNSVTATLADDGTFSVYNLQGSVDVVIDVVGYFEDHVHASTDITNEAGVAFEYTRYSDALILTGAAATIGDASIRVPSDGWVTVTTNVVWFNGDATTDAARCQITKGTTIDVTQPFFTLYDGGPANIQQITTSSTRVLPMAVADNPQVLNLGQPLRVVCQELDGEIQIATVDVQAHFVPTNYTTSSLVLEPAAEGAGG